MYAQKNSGSGNVCQLRQLERAWRAGRIGSGPLVRSGGMHSQSPCSGDEAAVASSFPQLRIASNLSSSTRASSASAVDALNNFSLLEVSAGHAADAGRAEIRVLRLDAAKAAKLLVTALERIRTSTRHSRSRRGCVSQQSHDDGTRPRNEEQHSSWRPTAA